MKRCISCNSHYSSSLNNCPSCGFCPAVVDGFRAYAPEFAHNGEGFKSTYFSELARLEDANFWFRSRNQLVILALEEYCENFSSFLEIGCGTGFVLSGISKVFQNSKLCGSEIFTEGLNHAASRLPSINFMQMDARNIPYVEEFDVIGAFDVLEHIEDDELVLSQIHTALKSQGFMLLTVPQHTWLWSAVDDYACHVRRYSASDLHKKIIRAGFKIVRSTSFITTLLPAMFASRLAQKIMTVEKFDASREFNISSWLNALFTQLLRLELILIRKGFSFPVGGSRLVVARKE